MVYKVELFSVIELNSSQQSVEHSHLWRIEMRAMVNDNDESKEEGKRNLSEIEL